MDKEPNIINPETDNKENIGEPTSDTNLEPQIDPQAVQSPSPAPETPANDPSKVRRKVNLPNSPKMPSLPSIPDFKSDKREQPQKKSKKKVFLIILVILLLLAGAAAAYYFLVMKDSNSNPTSSTDETTQQSQNNTLPGEDITINGNTYYANPKEITDLVLFESDKCVEGSPCENNKSAFSRAFLVGTTKDKKDIIAYRTNGGSDSVDIIFVKNSDKYEVVIPENITETIDTSNMEPSVVPSSSTKLDELNPDKDITIEEQPIKTVNGLTIAFFSVDDKGKMTIKAPEKGTKIFTKEKVEYYEQAEEQDNLSIKSITAYFGNLFQFDYSLSGELSSEGSTAAKEITWSEGEKTTSNYYTGVKGCSTDRTYLIAKVKKGELNEVGKTPGGQVVYQLDSDSPLVKELFEKNYNKGEKATEDQYKNLTVDQFTDQHGYFLIENGFNEYIIMLSGTIIPASEC